MPRLGSRVRASFSAPVVLKIFYCGNSSVGRAQPCQGWGREFEPRFPLVRERVREIWLFFLCEIFGSNSRPIDQSASGREAGSSLVFRSKSKSFEDKIKQRGCLTLFFVRQPLLSKITLYLIKHSIYPHCEQLVSYRINLIDFSNNISLQKFLNGRLNRAC